MCSNTVTRTPELYSLRWHAAVSYRRSPVSNSLTKIPSWKWCQKGCAGWVSCREHRRNRSSPRQAVRRIIVYKHTGRNQIYCIEFWDQGFKLFKDSPSTFPVPFLGGDILSSDLLDMSATKSSARPDLSSLVSLTELLGHVAVIHASAFFHLFSEGRFALQCSTIDVLRSPSQRTSERLLSVAKLCLVLSQVRPSLDLISGLRNRESITREEQITRCSAIPLKVGRHYGIICMLRLRLR